MAGFFCPQRWLPSDAELLLGHTSIALSACRNSAPRFVPPARGMACLYTDLLPPPSSSSNGNRSTTLHTPPSHGVETRRAVPFSLCDWRPCTEPECAKCQIDTRNGEPVKDRHASASQSPDATPHSRIAEDVPAAALRGAIKLAMSLEDHNVPAHAAVQNRAVRVGLILSCSSAAAPEASRSQAAVRANCNKQIAIRVIAIIPSTAISVLPEQGLGAICIHGSTGSRLVILADSLSSPLGITRSRTGANS